MMVRAPSPCGTANTANAVPVGMYGDLAMSRLASEREAHMPRMWSNMPPMTGRCMQMAVGVPVRAALNISP